MGIQLTNPGLGRLQYVGTTTLSGAATNIDIESLDLSAVRGYFFILKGQVNAAATNQLSWYVQTGGSTWQTTANEYYAQRFLADNAALAAARANDSIFTAVLANDYYQVYGYVVADQDGKPRMSAWVNRDDPAAIKFYDGRVIRNSTTNITGFRITSDQANGLLSGTTLEVWKITV